MRPLNDNFRDCDGKSLTRLHVAAANKGRQVQWLGRTNWLRDDKRFAELVSCRTILKPWTLHARVRYQKPMVGTCIGRRLILAFTINTFFLIGKERQVYIRQNTRKPTDSCVRNCPAPLASLTDLTNRSWQWPDVWWDRTSRTYATGSQNATHLGSRQTNQPRAGTLEAH